MSPHCQAAQAECWRQNAWSQNRIWHPMRGRVPYTSGLCCCIILMMFLHIMCVNCINCLLWCGWCLCGGLAAFDPITTLWGVKPISPNIHHPPLYILSFHYLSILSFNIHPPCYILSFHYLSILSFNILNILLPCGKSSQYHPIYTTHPFISYLSIIFQYYLSIYTHHPLISYISILYFNIIFQYSPTSLYLIFPLSFDIHHPRGSPYTLSSNVIFQ